MARHLTLEERDRIAQLRHQGADQQEIANAVGRCPSTISRELQRNGTGDAYYAGQAQRKSERRRRERPITRKMDDPQISREVRAGLAQDWAPEQITGRMKQQHPECSDRRVSPQTIYTWIKRHPDREHWESHLRRRGKRPCRRKNAATTGDAARIANRPEVIEQRLRLGDFEGDTVLGPPGTDLVPLVACSAVVEKLRAHPTEAGQAFLDWLIGIARFGACQPADLSSDCGAETKQTAEV